MVGSSNRFNKGDENEPYYNELLKNADFNINRISFESVGLTYLYAPDFINECEVLNSTVHTIKKCSYRLEGQSIEKEMAVKYINIPVSRYNADKEKHLAKLKELLLALKGFKELIYHENIVKFYGVCIDNGQFLLCIEFMDLSLRELYPVLHTEHEIFPVEFTRYIVKAILQALIACNSKNLNDRTVKPSNILFNTGGQIKLADYGEARILHDSMTSTFSGTLVYWPPENCQRKSNKKSPDMWSLGLTLLEIITNTAPYKDSKGGVPNNIIVLQNQIVNFKPNEYIDKNIEKFDSKTLKSLRECICLCLNKVDHRPNPEELLKTEFCQTKVRSSSKTVTQKWIKHYNEIIKKLIEAKKELPKLDIKKKAADDTKKVYQSEEFDSNLKSVQPFETLYSRHNTEIKKAKYVGSTFLAIKIKSFKSRETGGNDKRFQRFMDEILIMKKIREWDNKNITNWENIIYVYGYDITDRKIEGKLYMEFMDINLKELYIKLHARDEKFPADLFKSIVVGITNALSFCHNIGIVHCDVKPSNILMNQTGAFKLGDFDSAVDRDKLHDDPTLNDRIGGTIAYWPIEIFNVGKETGARHDPKRDIWSLGMTLAEVLLGRLPYVEKDAEPLERLERFAILNLLSKMIRNLDSILWLEKLNKSTEEFLRNNDFYQKFFALEYEMNEIKFLYRCLQPMNLLPTAKDLKETEFFRNDCSEIISKDIVKRIQQVKIYTYKKAHLQPQIQDEYKQKSVPLPSVSTVISLHENFDDLPIETRCNFILLKLDILMKNYSDFRNLLKDDEALRTDQSTYLNYIQQLYALKNQDITKNQIKMYDHFTKPKGHAIIFNMHDYIPNTEFDRKGSETDAKKMEELFINLGFLLYFVKTLHNLKKDELLETLNEFFTNSKEGSSYVVVLMAHEYKEHLKEKPKLFVVQACRGKIKDKGVRVDKNKQYKKAKTDDNVFFENVSNDNDAMDFEITTTHLDDAMDTTNLNLANADGETLFKLKNKISANSNNEESDDSSSIHDGEREPTKAHFLLLQSTARNTNAFIYPTNGSYFIEVFCKTFYTYAHRYSYSYMAKQIIKLVQENIFKVDVKRKRKRKTEKIEIRKHYRQQPQHSTTSGIDLYFFPGVYFNTEEVLAGKSDVACP